mmetsp:Transcript_11899/g.36264  ORF Transcript_11899/g.36264 Transcript_11899/m.36264 type:complete len:88 (-) Transcript_11899:903-1166(-)
MMLDSAASRAAALVAELQMLVLITVQFPRLSLLLCLELRTAAQSSRRSVGCSHHFFNEVETVTREDKYEGKPHEEKPHKREEERVDV